MIVALLVVAVLFVLAAHYYLWRRLFRSTTLDTPRGRLVRRLGAAALTLLGLLLVASLVGGRALPRMEETVLAWPGYLWLAGLFYLVLVLAILELPAWLARLATRPRGQQPADRAVTEPAAADDRTRSSRRVFIARTVAVTAGVATAGILADGMVNALGPPGIKRIDIPLAKLPRSADGFRIAVVSDIHLGPLRGYSHTRRIVDLVNGLDADVVAIVGDLVDGTVADLGPAVQPLRDLRSRSGAFFVTGNHEYFSGYREWVDEVAGLGVRPLRNERTAIDGFDLAGVNDATGGGYGDAPDYDRALADRDPARAVVLLAHQPIQAREAARRGVDLQLSGHTHGGQMVPFNLVVRASGQPVVSGLGRVDGMPVYVTNGAGFWGPPVRVGAPPDITLVRLRSV